MCFLNVIEYTNNIRTLQILVSAYYATSFFSVDLMEKFQFLLSFIYYYLSAYHLYSCCKHRYIYTAQLLSIPLFVVPIVHDVFLI